MSLVFGKSLSELQLRGSELTVAAGASTLYCVILRQHASTPAATALQTLYDWEAVKGPSRVTVFDRAHRKLVTSRIGLSHCSYHG